MPEKRRNNMKQQATETIKIVVGILICTVAVMSIIGFMLNMVLHPFIIILALIVLFVAGVIIAGVTMGYKGIIMVVSSFIFGWFGFDAYYEHTCGPNSSDVKVMKPMAEKISEYIVKNGIPESLKDIPDLPYELKKCKKEITYGDENDVPRKYITATSKSKEINEVCHYKNIIINLGFAKYIKPKDTKWNGSLSMNSDVDTTLLVYIEQNKNKNFYFREMSFYGKTDGICQSWKQ